MKAVSELIGAELDYWVGKAQGLDVEIDGGWCQFKNEFDEFSGAHGMPVRLARTYSPSSVYGWGGPIFQEMMESGFWEICSSENWQIGSHGNKICMSNYSNEGLPLNGDFETGEVLMFGFSLLVVAMRCLVASKFGDEVGE